MKLACNAQIQGLSRLAAEMTFCTMNDKILKFSRTKSTTTPTRSRLIRSAQVDMAANTELRLRRYSGGILTGAGDNASTEAYCAL